MAELRIFDKRDDGSGLLVPLSGLLRTVESLRPTALSGSWLVLPGSHGFGAFVCDLEDQIEERGVVLVDGARLFPLLMDGREYFFTGRMRSCEDELEIGIEDSTYLYLKGDAGLLDRVASRYAAIERP